MIIAPDRFDSLEVGGNEPTQRLAEWMEAMTRQINLNTPLTGTGSPEGVINASPTQLYMDESGTAGNILYIKKSGVLDTGWVLV